MLDKTDKSTALEYILSTTSTMQKFTWTIKNFTRFNGKMHYSGVFVVHGCKWRVLIFPKGNNVDHFSMYLDVADTAILPDGWSRDAQFSLAVVNQIQPKYTIRKDIQHQFNAHESFWGFTSFMPLSELFDPSRGYLVNDTVVVEVEVTVRKMVDYWKYGSKKETGYVGLENQGATGYMNSLLQTLYHIPYFRKAVYHVPTTEHDMPSTSIPLALQRLFYKLQYSDSSVATKELTTSFGWDTYDSFMQHDVQELNRVLCEKLEDKMKGTVVEGTIEQLFEGHHINYIECINVDYKSSRKESFYDLQLDVKGCCDVYSSFDKYVEVERLEGDNKYHADNHGLQDAKKGVLFLDFPPVLQLQLKRFEYESYGYMRGSMVKINDRYEFPLQLDLDRYDGKYLAPDADRSTRNLYTLHSVLVHSGGVHGGGHYYAFIRPTLSEQWYTFDDERVTKEDAKKALEEQYGGEEEYSNAYMLVYIRESDKEKIMCSVDEKDIAEHLRIRLKKEQEEKEHKKKEKAEAHIYTIIKVARDEDLKEQIGKDIYFDLVDHEKVRSFRIQKQLPFSSFKEEVAKEYGIPVQFQRFWLWAKRQNRTYRPNRPLTPHEEAQSVGQVREVSNKAHNAELKLFLEVELGVDLRPLPPPEKSKEDILLFFKLYKPEKEEFCFVGRLFVKALGKPSEILAKLNEMAGFSPNKEIELYEEIKFEPNVMCETIDKKLTFRSSQLEDGDIVCFQKSPRADYDTQVRCPDVPSFLEYVHNRQVVHFRSLEKPKDDDFSLELSKLHTYDDVVERVARQLGLDDPAKIRLTSHNCYSQQPKPQPVKYRGVKHLLDMLIHYNQTSDILYYEVLDIPLPELQFLKTLKVAFHHATKDEVVIHCIRLPKNSTIADVINDLKTKVELSSPNAELRLLEVFYHKIYTIFPLHEKIENINDQYWTLRAEEIPEEEKNIGPNDCLIHVYHFMKDPNQNQIQNFGDPFFLLIREGETLAEVKTRIQSKLQVPDEEFSKWKFAFISMNQPDYLQDSDVVPARFLRDVYGAWEQYLGLEHTDTAPKRAYTANQMDKVKVPKANWDAYATRVFCEICKEETLAGNRLGHTLSAIGYKNLEEKFYARTKRHYPHDKLKNKWDALKPQYNLWLDLKRAATGLGYDVQKGIITASDEWWEAKIAENIKYRKFRDGPMENLDELEVMFQHINVTGASLVIPGGPTNAAPIEIGDDSTEGEDDATIVEDEKKGGKRKINDNLPQNPKKKGRNPMVRQVTRLIDVISTGKTKNDQKIEDDIIELIEQAVNAGAYEGSDEHFMATKLFIKQEYHAVFKSFKTNEGKVAWLKRMYEERKRD